MDSRYIDGRPFPNDRINKAAQELGYCCAYAFLLEHSRLRDTHVRVAKKLKVGVSTVEFNRRKIRNGEMTCLGVHNCQARGEVLKAILAKVPK